MNSSIIAGWIAAGALAAAGSGPPAELKVDETQGEQGEWGFRPAEGQPSPTDPPAFVWRPQKGATAYELQLSREAGFRAVAYQAGAIAWNCHCPDKVLGSGTWHWRFRYVDAKGRPSPWSRVRAFAIAPGAVEFPMPSRQELLKRIPRGHPRLFIRPEDLPRLRELAAGPLKTRRDALVAECQKLLKDPPPTKEPLKYPPGVKTLSEEWREIWWGNRLYTIRVLDGAATLAFTRLLTGQDEYGQLARRLLLEAAEWDPKGATGYRYNDEAGMPYAYYFSRTYSFLHDLLTEEQRAGCRKVMAIRGQEMYRHLCPRHIWQPYSSHSNRAWHFLGEVAVAFLDELPEAADWAYFAANVFFNVYPVWSDADGGWHEGINYWDSYMHRFTWWADVMRAAMGIDVYRKPYFSHVGYYPMYVQPPGTKGGGFGDLCDQRTSAQTVALMSGLAAQARNGHWQWYVEAHGGPRDEGGYVGFVRGALPQVAPRMPDDLPTGRLFRGTGQAVLNTTLRDARDNVEVIFKSSPFGTQSHGLESNNAFQLYAFGERLLISTGRRDIYGSEHHRDWMGETKSTNCITVNGKGQIKFSPAAQGEIVAFCTSEGLDYVAGEAGPAYGGALKRFTRHVLFVKPQLVVIYDRLEAPAESTFEWRLHSPTAMQVAGQHDVRVTNGAAAVRADFLAPEGLELSLTDKFDVPPRERIKLVEWHLTAKTPAPGPKAEFVTVLHPHRAKESPPAAVQLHGLANGYALEAEFAGGGKALVLLRAADEGAVRFGDRTAEADLAAVMLDKAGRPIHHLLARGTDAAVGAGPWK